MDESLSYSRLCVSSMIATAVQRNSSTCRFLKQTLIQPKLAITGSYIGINTGDEALAQATCRQAELLGIPPSRQPLHAIDKWPKAPRLIMGGGAIGIEDRFVAVGKRYPNAQEVGALGIDCQIGELGSDAIEYIKRFSWLSVRSSRQATEIATRFERPVEWHPDLAFSLLSKLESKTIKSNPKIFGFNVTPFLVSPRGGRYLAWNTYPGGVGAIRDKGTFLAAAYRRFIREACLWQQAQGRRLTHIPFSPGDDMYARAFLSDLPIQFARFDNSPIKAFRRIQGCGLFLSTRYHSLVFSLMARVPCIPFNYSYKNRFLLDDIKAQVDAPRPEWLLEHENSYTRTLDGFPTLKLAKADLEAMCGRTHQAMTSAFSALMQIPKTPQ